MSQQTFVSVAIAILYREGKFLVQLRDDIPTIVHPGCWALFGGHLEEGETPDVAIKREIKEEIDYFMPPQTRLFKTYDNEKVIRHVYYAPLTVSIDRLTLKEGWDFALVSPKVIQSGSHYSHQAEQVRNFAEVHQHILLDFLNQ